MKNYIPRVLIGLQELRLKHSKLGDGTMKLFHGSYMKIEYPEISKGRTKVDFGQGFYLTGIKSQAENGLRLLLSEKDLPFGQSSICLN